MLDDLNFLAKYDKTNALALIGGWPAETLDEVQATWLEGELAAWVATSPVALNPAKQIARELAGFKLVVTTEPALTPVLPHWRNGLVDQPKRWVLRSVHLGAGSESADLIITPIGKTLADQRLWLCLLGEYVSAYLACLHSTQSEPLLLWHSS